MVGDGVSLPTSLSQLGQVAKTQAKGQQQAQPVTPFSQHQDQQEELRVKRVKETGASDHRRIEADDDRADKRKRRRQRRRRKLSDRRTAADEAAIDSPEDGNEETVGALIDLRA